MNKSPYSVSVQQRSNQKMQSHFQNLSNSQVLSEKQTQFPFTPSRSIRTSQSTDKKNNFTLDQLYQTQPLNKSSKKIEIKQDNVKIKQIPSQFSQSTKNTAGHNSGSNPSSILSNQ